MALHFDYRNVRDSESVTTDPHNKERWHPVFDALIWLSMICGYSRIDDKNKESVALRITTYQRVTGPMLYRTVDGKKESVYITKEDVFRYVGLRTNATAMTDAQFERKLGKMALDAERSGSRAAAQGQSALDIFGTYKEEAPCTSTV